ncbi:helix-turn-helix domain-containing protein [Azospirillum thermophilum]|uniref:AraC family transcriptional regulator n=1 Tax=Azospirillum thermophilum TaxID=2202148 RepID=A0A2S2CWE3_9PROT|nr:helix-turn-helix domain-containing protein [Azospirillum thermophilum]AWK88778.1 AraC family transcriptional regulator [Azospirillum thermophilum]
MEQTAGSAPPAAALHFPGPAVSPEEIFWAWREQMSVLWDVAVANRQAVESFQATLSAHHMGTMLIGRATASAQQFRRSSTTIARSAVDHYLVQLYETGGYGGVAGQREIEVRAGDICVVDLAQPVHTSASAFSNVNLLVPRAVLAPLLRDPDGLHGAVLSGQSALGRVLSHHLQCLTAEAPNMTGTESVAVAEGTAAMIARSVGPVADMQAAAGGARHLQILRIRRYIEEHLAAEELTPEHIADVFGLSRSTLYRLFEPLGGVTDYIRDRRLLRCFMEIMSSAQRHRRIADIAYDWGFSSESAFSRAFRRRFGMSPRDTRAVASSQSASWGTNAGTARLEAWIRSLG